MSPAKKTTTGEEKPPEHSGIYEALFAIQAETPSFAKDGANPHFGSRFVTLDAILETLLPLCRKHGCILTQIDTRDGEASLLRTVLAHAASNTQIETSIPIPLDGNPQHFGSWQTYARRYALRSLFCLRTGEDDDGNAAAKPKGGEPSEPITPKQATVLDELIDETRTDLEKFCGHYKIDSVGDLPADKYDEAFGKLKARKAQRGG